MSKVVEMAVRKLLCIASVMAALGAAAAARAGDNAQTAARIIDSSGRLAGVILDAAAQHQWDLANAANNRGADLMSAGDFAGAQAAFSEALSHLDDPAIRDNLERARRQARWKQAKEETDQASAVTQAAMNVATAAEFDRLTAPK